MAFQQCFAFTDSNLSVKILSIFDWLLHAPICRVIGTRLVVVQLQLSQLQNASLLFTRIVFNNFFARACAQISFIYFFRFSFFSSLFSSEEFPRKRESGENYLPWTSKGWKFSFEFLYRRFRAVQVSMG